VLAVVVATWWAVPADALTEARILDVSCGGLRIVQTGLPPDTRFEVEALDAADGRVLTESVARSTTGGRLDVRLATDLRGVHRLHGEVTRTAGDEEYGEADVDLNARCQVVGRKPVSAPTPGAASVPPPSGHVAEPSPAASQPRDSSGGGHGLGLGLLGGSLAVFGAALAVVVRRRRGSA
jgi:hypothetical protein